MNAPLSYQTLRLPPSARCDVLFAKIGARDPVIDLRSLFAALGMGWDRWHACAVAAGLQHGLALRSGRDVTGRATKLLWAPEVPRLLELLQPTAELLHPAGGRRMSQLRAAWGTNWGRSVAAPAFPGSVNAVKVEADATGADAVLQAPHRLLPKPAVVRITREVEAEVLRLTAEGMQGAAVARQLKISAASVCLLKGGKFRFAASEAARAALPIKTAAVPGSLERRRGRPPITRETEARVSQLKGEGRSLSQIAGTLNISTASASLLAAGKYRFSQSAAAVPVGGHG